ncbi:hypothetical protein OV450_8308 [Actinobacteria bacterium OV450]|nr:hypothetical protein OV450_8308 [Actinobacteria bacterium OV450]
MGGGPVDSASYSFAYTVSASCLAGSPITSGSNTFGWNSGPNSVTAETFVVTRPLGQTVVTGVGTVTSGQFAGYAVVHVITYPALNLLDCLGGGVTSQTGVESLTLTSA